MLKLANILVALFLAMAPGMNAVRLMHAVKACDIGALAALHEDHEHSHEQEPCDDTPPQDCPHFHSAHQGAPVMSVTPCPGVILPGPPIGPAPLIAGVPAHRLAHVALESRPPPGPPRVGCVQLLI